MTAKATEISEARELQIELNDIARDLETLARAEAADALPRMMTAAEILDRAVAAVALEHNISPEKMTDYRFCKITGFRQQTVSSWRRGKTHIAREYAATFAQLTGLAESYVYACLEHDRHTDPTVQRILEEIARKFWIRAASVLLALPAAFSPFNDARASVKPVFSAQAPSPSLLPSNVYYGNSRRRVRRRRRFPSIFPVPPFMAARSAA